MAHFKASSTAGKVPQGRPLALQAAWLLTWALADTQALWNVALGHPPAQNSGIADVAMAVAGAGPLAVTRPAKGQGFVG